jgi:hypothetical protein
VDYSFVQFNKRNARIEGRISLTKSDSVGFPSKFYTEENIKSYAYVVLFWDMKRKAIGIHFTNDDDGKYKEGRFAISKHEGYGGSVVVRSFLRSNGIDPARYSGRYEWKKHNLDSVGNVYVIELKERADRSVPQGN